MIYQYLKTLSSYFHIPSILFDIGWSVFMFAILAAFMIVVVLYLVLLERKLLAFFTIRKGPNRVGPWGLFQTMADALKLFIKEDLIPKNADKILFTLAPIIFFMPVMVLFGLIPYSNLFYVLNIATGLIAVFAITSFSTLGLLLAGWSSNNKYSLIGAQRAVIQVISYEVPLIITALTVCILSDSLNLLEITKAQTGSVFHWFILPNCIGFLIYFVCTLAEINRNPFDLPEAENELVSGYNTEYSGMKFAMFFLAEYAELFILSVLCAVLFLGGFNSPFGIYFSEIIFNKSHFLPAILQIEQVCWLIIKAFCLIIAAIWIRATMPRIRSDNLSVFCWKYLLPLALLNLLFIAVYKFLISAG